jgi:hypothetical protein
MIERRNCKHRGNGGLARRRLADQQHKAVPVKSFGRPAISRGDNDLRQIIPERCEQRLGLAVGAVIENLETRNS